MSESEDVKEFVFSILEPLGPSFPEVLCHLLKERLNGEPCEVLFEKPENFYKALNSVLGGENRVKMLIEMAVSAARAKYDIKLSVDEILEALKKGHREYLYTTVRQAAMMARQIKSLGELRPES